MQSAWTGTATGHAHIRIGQWHKDARNMSHNCTFMYALLTQSLDSVKFLPIDSQPGEHRVLAPSRRDVVAHVTLS